MTCEEAWVYLENVVKEGMSIAIPQTSQSSKKVGRPKWMNSHVIEKVKEKSRRYKKYRNTHDGVAYLAYARIRNQARWECRKAKKQFERSLAKEAKRNPKAVFSYANSRMETRSGIADLQTEEGMAVTDLEKSEAINDFFSSVFTIEEDGATPQLTTRDIKVAMPHLEITEAMVKKKLEGLNTNKSAGPDGLHPRVLRELSEVISKPLARIMQKSLTEEKLPQSWKDAHISPIFKKGSKSQWSNYRPISLTSVVCTQMEAIIRDHIATHIDRNGLLSNHQHGFVSGRSCSTQLISCLDNWTNELDQGHNVDTVYLDFSKAFDSVPHKRLLVKMENWNYRENTWMVQIFFVRSQTKSCDKWTEVSMEKGNFRSAAR